MINAFRTPNHPLYDPAVLNDALRRTLTEFLFCHWGIHRHGVFFTGNKAVVCALSASYISTFAGYPVCVHFPYGPCPNKNVTSNFSHYVARFYQVQVANDERLDNNSTARGVSVQRGGYHGFLSRPLDTLDDYFIRP